jgi:Ca2+-binding RTX toxin-like protein
VSYKRTRPGRQARAGVSVDLASRSATGKAIDRDRLARIERVIGTSFADALRGSDHADQLNGGAGEDRVNGRGRNDRLIGGKGRDIVHGSSGADELFGSRNSDRLYGDRGRDRLRGGDVPRTDDSDRCDGGAERDTANSCEVRVSIP